MIAENPRWDYNHPDLSQHVGLVPNLNTFDAQFFRVHFRLSRSMDSMGRKILEQSYQAIYDSGQYVKQNYLCSTEACLFKVQYFLRSIHRMYGCMYV